MKPTHIIGLGEPEPIGKKSLFQPAENNLPIRSDQDQKNHKRRIRTTIEFTEQTLGIIQEIQGQYRLKTGKVLPLWKLVNHIIGMYGQSQQKAGEGKEEGLDFTRYFNRRSGLKIAPDASLT